MEDADAALLSAVDALYEGDAAKALHDVRGDPAASADTGAAALVYGEVTSLERLFTSLELSANDLLVDIGSGRGQVVIAASMRGVGLAPSKAVGIELVEARHLVACAARDRIPRSGSSSCMIVLVHGDALSFDLTSATKIFVCNPTFGGELNSRLARAFAPALAPNLRHVATLAQFSQDDLIAGGLELRRVSVVATTWASHGCPLFVYGRTGGLRAGGGDNGDHREAATVVDEEAVSQMLSARRRADQQAMEAAKRLAAGEAEAGNAPTQGEAERGSLRTALIAAAMHGL